MLFSPSAPDSGVIDLEGGHELGGHQVSEFPNKGKKILVEAGRKAYQDISQ
jgi:hypothetical protein